MQLDTFVYKTREHSRQDAQTRANLLKPSMYQVSLLSARRSKQCIKSLLSRGLCAKRGIQKQGLITALHHHNKSQRGRVAIEQ